MVLDTLSQSVIIRNIAIQDYILEKFSPAKATEPYIDVIFEKDNVAASGLSNDRRHGQLNCKNLNFPFERTPAVSVPIKSCKFLVKDAGTTVKKVWELSLDVSHHDYLPGDTIGIIPSNKESDVNFVLCSMNLTDNAEAFCRLHLRAGNIKKTAKVPNYVPNPSTPLKILRDCLALRSVPKKQFLSALAECCSDDLEKSFLRCLSSKEGASFYNDLILKRALTLIDLLKLCPSCRPTLSLLCEHLPRLLPRPYSIASSPLVSNDVKIFFSILPENPGITTNMLENICKRLENDETCASLSTINMYFRNFNRFRYTQEDAESDNILIGIGTGVAPFLGFLEHKEMLKKAEDSSNVQGNTWLFTGAKTFENAFGRQTFQKYETCGTLQRYFEAFSQIKSWPMHYVQDLIRSNRKEFVEFLLKPKTTLFVCADGAEISKSIEICIKQCLVQELQIDDNQAEYQVKEYRNNGKYREDLWI